MWSRRSMTRTRLSSWVATRSATVRPKKPEPTMTRSGLAEVTPHDSTGAAGRYPAAETDEAGGTTDPRRRRGRPPRRPLPVRPAPAPRVASVSEPRPDAPLRVVAVTYSP